MRKTRITGVILAGMILCAGARTLAAPGDKPAPKAKDDKAAQAEKLFASGQEALFRGQYAQAIKLLTQAAAADKTLSRYIADLVRTDAERKGISALVQCAPEEASR